MSSLDPSQIAALLKEDAERATTGRRGPKVDPTLDRTLPTWWKLNHHMCLSDCPHRQEEGNTTHKACWNPECKDPRPSSDLGTNIVVAVKGQFICRYCFLAGYLLGDS
jgi:hypothetical protein